jgi:hypothetical protein
MSNTLKPIQSDDIQKSIIYKQGLTAELAVMKAFSCDLQLVSTIGQLSYYSRTPVDYANDYREELELNNERHSRILDDENTNRHKKIAQNKELMRKLKKLLLSDIHYQVSGEKETGLIISKHENLNFIEVDEYEELVEKLEYQNREIDVDEILPSTVPLELEDITVSFESLYKWFLNYSINVEPWSNLENFKKLSMEEVQLPKKRRNTSKAMESTGNVLGATIWLLSEKCTKFKKGNTPNIKSLSEEISANYPCLNKKGSVSNSLKSILDGYNRSVQDEHGKCELSIEKLKELKEKTQNT